MKVYRIQDEKKQGPYFKGVGRYNSNKTTYLKHDPGSAFCGLYCRPHEGLKIQTKHTDKRVCGCVSLSDLKKWFPCKSGRSAMEKAGYTLFEYTIDKRQVYEGYKQCTFIADDAKKRVELSLTNLK
ncbi:MAG: hypothetical protein ACYSWS_05935 [Planctomycetota bacterium]|jgi:hypothetical protein